MPFDTTKTPRPVQEVVDIPLVERRAVAQALRLYADAFEHGAISAEAGRIGMLDAEDVRDLGDWWRLERAGDDAFNDEDDDFDEDGLEAMRVDIATAFGIAALACLQAMPTDPADAASSEG